MAAGWVWVGWVSIGPLRGPGGCGLGGFQLDLFEALFLWELRSAGSLPRLGLRHQRISKANLPGGVQQITAYTQAGEVVAEQEEISLEVNRSKVGQRLRVIVDREEADYYVGRSEYDSPEVDPEILISAQPFELFAEVS